MGAITKIRQLSPYFLAVIAVLFIAFMVIQDSSCTNIRDAARSPENTVIGEVNGTTAGCGQQGQQTKAPASQPVLAEAMTRVTEAGPVKATVSLGLFTVIRMFDICFFLHSISVC